VELIEMDREQDLRIFNSVREAIAAGFGIDAPVADAYGFLHASMHTSAGMIRALVYPDVALF
jgi:hypothetical protein